MTLDNLPLSPWRKWWADLSGTRTQLTYLVVGLFAATLIRGLFLASEVAEIVTLLGVLTPALVAILGWHFAGKVLETNKANGEPPR